MPNWGTSEINPILDGHEEAIRARCVGRPTVMIINYVEAIREKTVLDTTNP